MGREDDASQVLVWYPIVPIYRISFTAVKLQVMNYVDVD